MSEKTGEKQLNKRELLLCELRYKDELNDEEIAKKVGIAPSTLYEWLQRPRIIAGIERLGRADTQKALRFFQRSSVRAAKATVKLTETRPVKDEEGKETKKQEFIQPGEVVRKAAADILQGVEINVKTGEGGGAAPVHVYLPDNNRQKTSNQKPDKGQG